MIPRYLFTVTIAVDNEHLEELRCVLPTWHKYKPELFTVPWVVIAHWEVEHSALMAVLAESIEKIQAAGRSLTTAWVDAIPGTGWVIGDTNNRETMLSALLLQAPKYVRTPYYLKIDTDVVALPSPCGEWVDERWFKPPAGNASPAIIASPWGYTKPAEWMERLDRWGDRFKPSGMMDDSTPERVIVGNVARSRRIISWLMFGNTEFTRLVATMCGQRLPVPSQDTTLWYAAERMGQAIRRVRMSQYGWRHVGGGGRRLREAVKVVMGADHSLAEG